MFLRSLSLVNFKNYRKAAYHFDQRIVCFTGLNGMGKTNLLDAIYTLCLSKSYFSSTEAQNILHGEDFFRLDAKIERQKEEHTLKCVYQKGKRKELEKDGLKYEKLTEHVGQFPVVIITPDDNQLINGGSEERRRFLDSLLSQLDNQYLYNLQAYLKLIEQRNSFLKRMAEQAYFDASLLATYDGQLEPFAMYIFKSRKEIIQELEPVFNQLYQMLCDAREQVKLAYKSDLLDAPLPELLLGAREIDRLLKRTNKGVHRDDMLFEINDFGAKQFGSQGQQKSFLIAMKLAQYHLLRQQKGIKPLLLLDDIFDKLDAERCANLLGHIQGQDYGQIFITDTQRERLEKLFPDTSQVAFYEVKQ
ncbi:MAG: DNA replication and repair protein RecF [Chitinophagales bacterium]|nr:DNA replication and repair protein RecF [Chitinophagales bacterium]